MSDDQRYTDGEEKRTDHEQPRDVIDDYADIVRAATPRDHFVDRRGRDIIVTWHRENQVDAGSHKATVIKLIQESAAPVSVDHIHDGDSALTFIVPESVTFAVRQESADAAEEEVAADD